MASSNTRVLRLERSYPRRCATGRVPADAIRICRSSAGRARAGEQRTEKRMEEGDAECRRYNR